MFILTIFGTTELGFLTICITRLYFTGVLITNCQLLGYSVTDCTEQMGHVSRLSSEKVKKKERSKQESKAVGLSVTYKVS